MQKLYLAIPLYLVITLIIWFVKPPITYNPQRKQFRPFGTGKHATLLPMWLLSMLIAVLAYLAASMANVWGWFSTRPSTQATQATHEIDRSELEEVQHPPPMQMWSVEPLPSTNTAANTIEMGDDGALQEMAIHDQDVSFADPIHKAIPTRTDPSDETMMYRRRTMAGGGYRPTTTQSSRTQPRTQPRTSHTRQPHQQPRRPTAHSSTRSSINTRLTRHPDAKRQRAAIRDSRVWKQAMQ